MPLPQAPAAGEDTARDEGTSTRTPSAASRDEGISTVSAAVAEMDRRAAERRAAKKAEKAKAEADTEDDVDPEDPDADPRRVKKAKPEKDDEKPAKKAKADDEGDDDAEDGDDDPDDDEGQIDRDDAEEGDADEEDDEDDDKPAKKVDKPPAKIKLNLGDREVEATPEEASHYVRQATQERQQAAQARQHVQAQAQQLQQHGAALAQLAQSMVGAEPDLSLAQTDPQRYLLEQGLYKQRMGALQAVQHHINQAAQMAQAQQQQAFGEFVQRERQALLKAVPELADPTKLASFQGRIAKVAQQYGYGPQEMAQAYDSRIFLMLRDLGRLADMDEQRSSARKKLTSAPPLKAPAPGSSNAPRNAKDSRAKEAKSRFLKSGRTMRDVRAYLERTER